MSELVLTNQASPGAMGANMSAFFFNAAGDPSYVGADGIVWTLQKLSGGGDYNVSGNLAVFGRFILSSTAAANVGDATINKPSGRVTAAAGATSVVVTCNMVAASSHVMAMAAANDLTGRVTAVTPAAGNFTISLVAPTANMPIDFMVVGAV